jgi:AraC-like DNA-binding protein
VLRDALLKIVSACDNLSESRAAASVVYGFIGKYYDSFTGPGGSGPGEDDIKSKVRFLILKKRTRASVSYVASRMGYAPDYLSTLFKKKTGEGLKQFIDTETARTAEYLLLFPKNSVRKVSEKLGFSDQFAFSRFFKRVTGTNPVEIKKRAESS